MRFLLRILFFILLVLGICIVVRWFLDESPIPWFNFG